MSRPLGFKMSEQHKENIRKAHKGMKKPWSGKFISELGRKKLKEKCILQFKNKKLSQEHIDKIQKSRKGYRHTKETKEKIGIANHLSQAGLPRPWSQKEKSPNWKGGITPINQVIRKSLEYRLWREAIFKRDDYTCVFCKIKGGNLCVDHIKPFAYYPELRFAIDNGRTLCRKCHLTTDTYSNRYKKQL